MCEGWGKCLRCWDALHERLCHPRALYHLQLLPVTTLRCWDGRFDWHCWRRLRASKCRFNCQPEIFSSKLQTWYFKTNYCVYQTCLKVSYWYTSLIILCQLSLCDFCFPRLKAVELFPKPPLAQGPLRGYFVNLLDSQNISDLRDWEFQKFYTSNILSLKVPFYLFNNPLVQRQVATQEKKCFGEQAAKLELLVSCPQLELHTGRPPLPALEAVDVPVFSGWNLVSSSQPS